MLALRKLEFGLDFPTSKLKQAHGEAAVGVLDFLTDRAVEKTFSWRHPEYSGEAEEEAVADEDADVGGIEDEVEVVEEEETLFKEAPSAHVEEDDDYKAAHEILRSGIDPIAWQTELERVGPRLRVAAAHGGGKEWRAHIEATKANEAKIAEVLPATKKQLTAMSERVSDARDKINLKENYINKQFEAKKESFATLKEELNAVEAAFTESTENVNKLTNELAGIAESLEEMKGTMADRGNSMTDTSPLVHIKQALKQIKAEVVTFDLQIGVVGHTLMQQKLRHGSPNSNGKGFKMRGKTNNDAVDFEDDSDMESSSL